MAIRLAEGLPAAAELAEEGVPLFSDDRPARRVLLVNLMPEKQKTERQIARKLGLAGPDIALSLAVPSRYRGKNADPGHMGAFYGGLDRAEEADGVVLTGAPIELLDFEEVDYWEEVAHLLDGLRARKTPLFTLCWAAQAALYRYHGLPKHTLTEKRFGVFEHRIAAPASAAVAGLEGPVAMPVSRHTETRREDLGRAGPGLDLLLDHDEANVGAVAEPALGHVHALNHFEYEAGTLDDEYRRDLGRRDDVPVPRAYYPDDDPARPPGDRWRAAGERFYANWVAMLAR